MNQSESDSVPNANSSPSSDNEMDIKSPEELKYLITQLKDQNISNTQIIKVLGLSISGGESEINEINAMDLDDLIETLSILLCTSTRKKLNQYNTIDDVVRLIQESKKIVFITGAGISTSCGIPDFRSPTGLYNMVKELDLHLPDTQAVFDKAYFDFDPRPFYKISKLLFQNEKSYTPSLTHRFMATVEKKNILLRNYTQNIDALENKAGIKKVIQCHGSYNFATCTRCGYRVSFEEILPFIKEGEVAYCEHCPPIEINGVTKSAPMKPSIVFFGEQLPEIYHDNVKPDMIAADLIFVIGSSLKVAPVNQMIRFAKPETPVILINREIVGSPDRFDVELLGDCDAVISELIYKLGWAEEMELEPQTIKTIVQDEIDPNHHTLSPYFTLPYSFCPPSTYIFPNGVCRHMSTHPRSPEESPEED